MNMQTLIRHRDIQNWVADRQGQPALKRVPDRFGTMRARLALSFSRAKAISSPTQALDEGVSPCSWTAWLAELDRQQLALQVSDADYAFVARKDLN